MPYIKKDDRNRICTADFYEDEVNTPGELNYLITTFLIDYVKKKGLSYTTINEVVGVLDCAKAEFYRRVAVPYENEKIAENGDVYTCKT